MARGLKWLQGLIDQLLFKFLQLFFEFAVGEVLTRHTAEKGLFRGRCEHLDVLKVSSLGLDLENLVKRWNNLNGHRSTITLSQKLIKQYPQTISSSVFRWDALDMDGVIFELLGVFRLYLPRVVQLISFSGNFASVLNDFDGKECNDCNHENMEPTAVVGELTI